MEPICYVNGIFPAYLAKTGFNISQIEANFAYVLDAKGWKLYKRNGVAIALIPVDSVQGMAELPEVVNFTATRIPLDLIRTVTAWFKKVYGKFHSEAVGYLYYNPVSYEWKFIPPTQTATGGSAKYDEATKIEDWQVVGTIHSHAGMDAFHSGTDDHDEKSFDGIHITVGRLDSVPEYSCSIVVQGMREIVDPAILIDGMTPATEIPTSWLEAVKESAPRISEPIFQSRVSTLYQDYYDGKISEPVYKERLAQIEKEIETYRKQQAEQAEREARMLSERERQITQRDASSIEKNEFPGYGRKVKGGKKYGGR